MPDELTYDNVVEVLVARVPELQPIYEELLDHDDGEILRYPFIAHVAWFAEALAAQVAEDPTAADTLRRLAAVLEEIVTSKKPYLHDLMAAGFVEAMNPDAPGFDHVVGLMGPASRAEVELEFGV